MTALLILVFLAFVFAVIFGIVALISFFFQKTTDNANIKRTSRGFWVHINDITMDSPKAQEVFDWYKKIICTNNMRLEDVKLDVNLRREWRQMNSIKETLPDDNDMVYLEAIDTQLFVNGDYADNFIPHPQEEVFYCTKSVEAKTMQRIYTNLSYSGFRYNDNGFRMGNITYYTKNVEGLKHFADGEIILTNQRVIFRGGMKTITIPIGNIIGIENFENDGIIIFLSNRVNPIVFRFLADKQFFYNQIEDVAFFNNCINDFYYYMEKVLYKRLVPKEIQETRKEINEVKSIIAQKTMIAEGLETEKK